LLLLTNRLFIIMEKEKIITQKVKEFYETLPFNKCSKVYDRAERITSNAVKLNYPDLDKLLTDQNNKSVLEIGCGTGWLSNTIGYNYDVNVVGVDLTAKALNDAQELSNMLKLSEKVKFVEADLFSFDPGKQFDVLVSMGVLHHTFNTQAALYAIENFIRPGGFIYIGLYHYYGRKVFLKMFSDMVALYGEQHAFDLFVKMSGKNQNDITFQNSWFRDQVCHVHETQHTFEEVYGWLKNKGFKVISTSINKFQEIKSFPAIFKLEKQMTEISYKKNYIEQNYFPGFFTIAAVKGYP
jgi:2-polyprenyl-3-methyl-5-hydroxy-6-metoxy-1,4-benzoquinol methylase